MKAERRGMEFARIREEFPALGEMAFLDAACVSLAPRCATEAIERFLEMARRCPARSATQQHIAMDAMREEARSRAARLVGAVEDELALVESTSHGLSIAAQAIPLARGDRIVLPDLEFLEVAVPWVQLRDRIGIELDVVASRDGAVRAEDIAARLTPRTRVVAVSSVQWSSGFRMDLAALGRACREAGVWLVVDAIQQLGAIPFDVRATPVDFLACGGHKWLNAPFGQGFLYIRRDRLPELRRPIAGYMSVATPEGGWGNYFQTPSIAPVQDYRFVEDARAFETGGTANYPGAAGLAGSLGLLEEIGTPAIAERILELTDYLLGGLHALGDAVRVVTPEAREHRSGIITFTLGEPEANLALMEFLLDRRVLVSVRYTSGVGGVRVSCHFFNSRADLDSLLEGVEDFAKRKGKSPSA